VLRVLLQVPELLREPGLPRVLLQVPELLRVLLPELLLRLLLQLLLHMSYHLQLCYTFSLPYYSFSNNYILLLSVQSLCPAFSQVVVGPDNLCIFLTTRFVLLPPSP